jgi:hypothetical protein
LSEERPDSRTDILTSPLVVRLAVQYSSVLTHTRDYFIASGVGAVRRLGALKAAYAMAARRRPPYQVKEPLSIAPAAPEQEALPLNELPVNQRHSYERVARNSHPWLESPDLSRAVLRTIPRKLSTGEDGISFIVEYHCPDSPNDRDVLFTSPLTITIPGKGPS